MPIRVLIVDDSALMRQVLSEILSSAPGIEVVGTAPDPYAARERIKTLQPDVLTLDIEMPRMDGLSFLEKLMALRPMPVVVVSTLTQKGADTALRALELGAVDYVAKPLVDLRTGMSRLHEELVGKVTAAAKARLSSRPRLEARQSPSPIAVDHRLSTVGCLVAIGASTGGVEALHALLTAMPASSPAIVVTQHMPPMFTASFARRLDGECSISVSEASDRQTILPGHAYIAPGGQHLEVVRSGAHYVCRVHDEPPVSGHRPSVDVLFSSVAASAGRNAVGAILTGMGRDGANGLLAMRRAGARTFGQDEASCVVYGMPGAAKAIEAVDTELPLRKLPQGILDAVSGRAHA